MNTIKKYAIPFILLLICCLLLIATFIPYYNEECNEQYNKLLKYDNEYWKMKAIANDYEDQYDEMYSSWAIKKLTLSSSEFSKYESNLQRLKRLSELTNEEARVYRNIYVYPNYQQYTELVESRETLQTIFGVASAIVFVVMGVSSVIIYRKAKNLNISETQNQEK